MKTTTILAILLFICINTFSQIRVEPTIELGYIDRSTAIFGVIAPLKEGYTRFNLNNNMFTDMSINARWKDITLTSSVNTCFKPTTFYSYTPTLTNYTLGLKYDINNIQFKVEHMCGHYSDYNYFRESYNKVSIKIYLWKN